MEIVMVRPSFVESKAADVYLAAPAQASVPLRISARPISRPDHTKYSCHC